MYHFINILKKDIGLYNLLFCENHVLLTGSSCLSLPFIPIYMDDGGTGFANKKYLVRSDRLTQISGKSRRESGLAIKIVATSLAGS